MNYAYSMLAGFAFPTLDALTNSLGPEVAAKLTGSYLKKILEG